MNKEEVRMHYPESRWTACFIHLLLSVVIFLLLFVVIKFYWFPSVFFEMGAIKGIKIVAAVDLVLGPILTLIIYNRAKKELKWDLSIIASIQLFCLMAGMWLVYQERPVLQVYTVDEVHVLTVTDLKLYDINFDIIKEYGGDYPKAVYVDLPKSMPEINLIIKTTRFLSAIPLVFRSDLYRDLRSNDVDSSFLWRFEKLEAIPGNLCRKVEVKNQHFNGVACFDPSRGLIFQSSF